MSAIHDFVATQSGACARCSLPKDSRLHSHPLTTTETLIATEFGRVIGEGVTLAVESVLGYVTPVAAASPSLGHEMLAQIVAKLSSALETP